MTQPSTPDRVQHLNGGSRAPCSNWPAASATTLYPPATTEETTA